MSALRIDDRHDRPLELAALAIDFDLTAAERGELEAHLAACSTCTRRVAALRADARTLGRPLTLLPSARVDAAVHAAITGRQPRPQRLVLLAAAALLLLAMLGAVAVGAALLRDLDGPPTTDRPQPSQPVAIVSPDPEASPAVVGDTWQTLTFAGTRAGGLVEAGTFMGNDLVGVGRGGCRPEDAQDPTDCSGTAWTSTPDGALSQALEQPGLALGLGSSTSGPEKGIYDVAAGPAGLVAIGYDIDPLRSTCAVAPCTSGPAVWRSPDGQTWERVQVDFGPGFIDRFSEPIAAIAAGPLGYVMVGYAQAVGPSGEAEARATAWASPDGLTWTRAQHSEDLTLGGCLETGEQPDCGGMRAVAATPTGFVAVGYRYAGGTTRTPAAWTSPDGLTWTLSMAGLDFQGDLASVASGPAGLVAVGTICEPACDNPSEGVAATSRDGSTWTFAAIPGAIGLTDVASTGSELLAFGERDIGLPFPPEVQLWTSVDGAAWQPITNLPTIADAEGYHGTDLVATSGRVAVIGWAQVPDGDGTRNFAYVSPPLAVPAAPVAEPGPDASAAPTDGSSIPARLPVASGSVQMAPAPDGGLVVVIGTPQATFDGPPSRTVISRLEADGSSRPGWPIELVGWTCLRPGDPEAVWPPTSAEDGSVTVVCNDDGTTDRDARTAAFTFDTTGRRRDAWSVPELIYDHQAQVVDGRLHVITGDREGGALSMTLVDRDGTVQTGTTVPADGLAELQMGPDGTGYRLRYAGGDGDAPASTEITRFGVAGVTAGWPVSIDAHIGPLAFGPDGQIIVTRRSPEANTSQTLVFDRDGRRVPVGSDELPMLVSDAWNGASLGGGSAPLLAPDGTTFVLGEPDGRTTAYAIDASGQPKDGWPYSADVGLGRKGACSGLDQGCGVWQANHAVGPDGTLYIAQAAPHDRTGGSIVAIAPDGTVRPGWPVYLTKAGAAFWSVVVGADGTAYALAIEPETGRATSATILAIAPDSTVLSRTTVIEP